MNRAQPLRIAEALSRLTTHQSDPWLRLLLAFVVSIALIAGLQAWTSAEHPEVLGAGVPGSARVLDTAELLRLGPDGTDGVGVPVRLPYLAPPREADRLRLRIAIDVPTNAPPQGVCITGWNSAGSVTLDGLRLQNAPPGALAFQGRTGATYVALPPTLTAGRHVLDIDVGTPRGISTTLSPLWAGDGDFVRHACNTFDQRQDVIRIGSLYVMIIFGLVTVAVGLLQRDGASLWLAAMTLAWTTHYVLTAAAWPGMSEQTWVTLFYLTRALGGFPMVMFCLRFGGLRKPWFERALKALFLVGYATLPFLSVEVWPLWMLVFSLVLMGMMGMALTWLLHQSLSGPGIASLILSVAMFLVIVTNLMNIARWAGLLPYAPPQQLYANVSLLSLGLIALMLERLTRYMRSEADNADRMRWELGLQREQLARDHELLLEQQQRIAVLEERRRIVRDMHDGLGTHLVSASALARGTGEAQAPLKEMIDVALQEFRSVLDVLSSRTAEDSEDDSPVTLLLAKLRHRIEPALRARGIALAWDIDPLPGRFLENDPLRLQLLRLLQEAFANVIKHSGASRVRFTARAANERVTLEVCDDGRGIGARTHGDAEAGHGLFNMRARAELLGGTLDIADAAPGTCVRLTIPVNAMQEAT